MLACQVLKNTSCTAASDGSHRLLIECVVLCTTFVCIVSALYTADKDSVSSAATLFGIANDDSRLKLLLRFIVGDFVRV